MSANAIAAIYGDIIRTIHSSRPRSLSRVTMEETIEAANATCSCRIKYSAITLVLCSLGVALLESVVKLGALADLIVVVGHALQELL